MTKRKLIWLIVFFVIYEIAVWALSFLFLPESSNLLVGFVLTVCGVTVCAVYWLVARLSAASRPGPEAAAAAGPSPAAAPIAARTGAQDDDAASIAALIREANERLAHSPTLANQRVKNRVNDFPLYLIAGSEGSGKTSTFLASGVEPELLAGQVYRESAVAPTRLGNIWFARGAIVVEAAGSLFSGDGARWNRLVSSLVAPRGRSWWSKLFAPSSKVKVGGLILCCDITPFKDIPDTARLAAMARTAQQRLRALGESIGHDVPVYVIFTKSDSIRYFGEYFGRLTSSEEQQVLGCSLNPAEGLGAEPTGVYADTESARISASLNRLYLSLVNKRLTFLARETERSKKPSIYEFPREFKRIRGSLVQFLVEVFRPNPLQPNPRLRGIYFTGTRKVAEMAASGSSPLDRTIVHRVGDVTRILRAEDIEKLRNAAPEPGHREAEVTRWSFTSPLWQQILSFPAAVSSTYVNRQQQWYRKAFFASAAAVAVILIGLFINSFFQNRALVRRVDVAVSNIEPVSAGAPVSLTNLRELDTLRANINEITGSGPGILERLGFYEGRRVAGPALQVYLARFREYFLNPLVGRLEAALSSVPGDQNAAAPYQAIYTDLKVYRTITKSGAEPSCMPDSGLTEEFVTLWRKDGGGDREAEGLARANIQFYLNNLKANRVPDDLRNPSKDEVVRRARDYLNAFRGVDPEYRRIIDQVNSEKQAATLMDLTHNDKYRSVIRVPTEVPAAFTRAAWDRVQELIENAGAGGSADSCVLGRGGRRVIGLEADSDIKAQLRSLYTMDYIQHWSDFLAKTSVPSYGGCAEAAQKLEILKDNDSPILAALVMVAENTTFPKHAPATAQSVVQAAQSGGKGLREFFGRVKESGKAQASKALGETGERASPEDTITSFFQPVHAVFAMSPPSRERWIDSKNTPYLDALANLGRAMQSLDRGGRCNAEDQASNNQASGEIAKAHGVVDTLARGFDNQGPYEDVKRLLQSPIDEARRWINTDPTGPVRQRINGAQQQLCASLGGLKNKYPFDPRSRDDARLDAVTAIFEPRSGQLSAVKQIVADDVVPSPGGWMQKPDAPVKLSRAFLDFMGRMSLISEALFPPQGARYKIAVRPNPAVKQIVDTLDGQPFSMSGKEYTWPPSQTRIDLRVEQSAGGSTPLRSYSGIWSVFKLLASAEHQRGTNQYLLTYSQGDTTSNKQAILPDGSSIVLEVLQYPNGISQVFDKDFFALSCPARATE